MITSSNLSSLPSEELIKRLHKREQLIAIGLVFCVSLGITAFSVGFASGFVFSKGVDYAIAKNRN